MTTSSGTDPAVPAGRPEDGAPRLGRGTGSSTSGWSSCGGPSTTPSPASLAIELMTLDATGDDPVHLHIDCPGGTLEARPVPGRRHRPPRGRADRHLRGPGGRPCPRAPGGGPPPPGHPPCPFPALRARLRAVGPGPRARRLGGQPPGPIAAVLRAPGRRRSGMAPETLETRPRHGPFPRRRSGARVRPHRRDLWPRRPRLPACRDHASGSTPGHEPLSARGEGHPGPHPPSVSQAPLSSLH